MLAVAGKTRRITVAAYPQGSGSRVVIGSDSRTDIAHLRQWLKAPRASDVVLPIAQEEHDALEAPASAGMAARLQELTDLKDAGLITQEEYETKRKDLLDRM